MMTAEEVVRAEIAAWSRNDADEVMSHFAQDAAFDIGPSWPRSSGGENIKAWREYDYPPNEA